MLELLLTCHSREVIQFQNCCNKSKLAINQSCLTLSSIKVILLLTVLADVNF